MKRIHLTCLLSALGIIVTIFIIRNSYGKLGYFPIERSVADDRTTNVKTSELKNPKSENTNSSIYNNNNNNNKFPREFIHIVIIFPLLETDAWQKQGYNLSEKHLLKERQMEYVECLRINVRIPTVTKIHIFSDQPDVLRQKCETEYAVPSQKLHMVKSSSNPTFLEVFKYVSDNLQGKLVFIVNADNYLADGFDRINHTWWQNNPNQMYALTRHTHPLANKTCKMGPIGYCDKNGTYFGSHDGFLFYLNKPFSQDFLKELDYKSISMGAENVVIWAFRKYLRYQVTNPCRKLVLYHHHCTNLRSPDTFRRRVDRPNRTGLADYI